MYVKIRKVTYILQTTPFQYRYLLHEIQKTERMYQYFCHQLEQMRTQTLDMKQIYEKMKHYQRHYMKYMHDAEVDAMYAYLCSYAQQIKEKFYCDQGILQFRWRNISIYSMIHAKYYWQKEPLIYHWKIHHSRIVHRKYRIFLIVEFIEEGL